MKTDGKHRIIRLIGGSLLLIVNLFPVRGYAQGDYSGTEPGTAAYAYYLAQSIINSYQIFFNIDDEFQKKPITTTTLGPRNVYERSLAVMEEFNTLFPGSVSRQQQDEAYAVDADKASPTDVENILILLQQSLQRQNLFEEYTGLRADKTPNDVYQIMREIGWFHRQIAEQRQIETSWDSPEQVYETVVYKFLPTVYNLAERSGMTYKTYTFPRQPSREVKPRNVYKLVIALYNRMIDYYQLHDETYDAVEFLEITDCDEITPADVFDLEQIVTAELRLHNPSLEISGEIVTRFTNWRASQKTVVPGHVFRLLQHLYLLTGSILQQEG